MPSDQLIPIDRIAKIAKTDKIHLAYLTRLRLLPQTIRRKMDGKITGCYPEDVLARVRQIEEMKSRGLTYSQIRYQLYTPQFNHPASPSLLFSPSSIPVAFLIVGLLLGYILANLNNLNNSRANQTLSAAILPSPVLSESTETQNISVYGRTPNQNQPIYLIAMPSENLYKLGKVEFNDLIR